MRRIITLCILVQAVGLFAFQGIDGFPIIVDTDQQGALNSPQDLTVVRERAASISSDLFELAETAGVRRDLWPQYIDWDLFEDASFQGEITRIERVRQGSLAISGNLVNIPLGSFRMVVRSGVIMANILMPDGFYQIRYAGEGRHGVFEIDQSQFPQGLEPTAVDTVPRFQPTPNRDSGDIIDLMVVYTTAAKNAAGGLGPIEALIDLAVAETNGSYENSNVNPRVRLVHTMEVDYAESGNIGTDRDRLRIPNDGFIDEVHAVREEYGADLVPMIVNNGGGFCGVAYIMTSVSTDFRDFGFCIVARNCATGYFSFGHEMGHIQSARHDYFVDGTVNSPFAFNHGFTSPPNNWRTIMAYNNACSGTGGCTRLQYWSNPEVEYQDDGPMGVPLNQSQPAFNAMTLNETAFTVANFMQAVGCDADSLEPNNNQLDSSPVEATMLGTQITDLNICSGDEDWYEVTVPGGHRFEAVATFIHNNGDLDLVVYDAGLNPVGSSNTSNDFEMVTLTPGVESTFYVKVYSGVNDTNEYELNISASPTENFIYSYWNDASQTFCGAQPATVKSLICYISNGYACAPQPCQ